MDFKKTFDTVPTDLLWQVLEGLGISGRILECLHSMYCQDQVYLHHPEEGLTPIFLYLLLFGLFIYGLEKQLNVLKGDAQPMLGQLVVRLLLYADNLALMSHTPTGLQKQLDVLQAFCYEHQLTVNVKKTKVVVFEARKFVCQAFQYEGEIIE